MNRKELEIDTEGYSYANSERDLAEFISLLWSRKWVITQFAGVAAIVSVSISLILPNIYVSSALLAPVENSPGALSSLIKQYGGLASLAGISLPGAGDDSKAALAKELMTSRAFVSDFIERRQLLPTLMATDSWDSQTGELRYDPDLYDIKTDTWVRDVDPPFRPKPSMLEAHEEFLELLDISENRETGYLTVRIEHQSPLVAQQWVTWLVDDINTEVKNQDVAEAERSIEYLRVQIANTSLSDLQTMFFELIQSQTETIMLAQVRPEYVFKTIDPAVVPDEESKPKRALICILGTLFGAFVGIAWVWFSHNLRVRDQ